MSDITSTLNEQRSFPPPESFQSRAHIRSIEEYEKLWQFSKDHSEKFWHDQAKSLLHWHVPFNNVLDWNPPYARWFSDGKINVSYNCLDRHLPERGGKPAIIWEGEPGDSQVLTYSELHQKVCQFANALLALKIGKGDCVSIYMPMIPEAAIAMLACARIGATHSVVFGGFSADALAERNNDADAKCVITADGGWRRGESIPLKANVDLALAKSPSVNSVIVVNRTGDDIKMKPGRDYWWHELNDSQPVEHTAQAIESEHPLFILYTSGSTGKPKGILHTSAGYLLGTTLTSKYVFDLKEEDIFWCTADVGWITGHSYVVYGPLSNGSTIVMYEGAPMHPKPDRFWEIIDKHKVSIFYTAPTAIRAFLKQGSEWPKKHSLKSLRLLGTVGEPINPEAWMWYREHIGNNRCPIVDTWWQTETGAIMITPLPGATTTVPGSATKPFFGIDPAIVDTSGNEVSDDQGGFLVIKKPWPSMLRTIHGNDHRYRAAYWEQLPGCYFTGDGARKDSNGNFWIMGRIDDVLNVSGHRLSTMEIESALVSHPFVAEAAVVGKPHELKGECIVCFVTLEGQTKPHQGLDKELKEHVAQHIGALARPELIRFTEALPKTRSGKIMRRLLRDIAKGQKTSGDVTTLEDYAVLAKLQNQDA